MLGLDFLEDTDEGIQNGDEKKGQLTVLAKDDQDGCDGKKQHVEIRDDVFIDDAPHGFAGCRIVPVGKIVVDSLIDLFVTETLAQVRSIADGVQRKLPAIQRRNDVCVLFVLLAGFDILFFLFGLFFFDGRFFFGFFFCLFLLALLLSA